MVELATALVAEPATAVAVGMGARSALPPFEHRREIAWRRLTMTDRGLHPAAWERCLSGNALDCEDEERKANHSTAHDGSPQPHHPHVECTPILAHQSRPR
jgi:hypothetical protein